MMTLGPVHRFLADDHAHLDDLLCRSLGDGMVDREPYEKFRVGLLRHIAMEEKVLLPEARRLRGGEPLPIAKQLRADHAALAALLVPTPTSEILTIIRGILHDHNPLEEGPEGLYAVCEELAATDVNSLLARLKAVGPVPVAPHFDGPRAGEQIARLLRARSNRD